MGQWSAPRGAEVKLFSDAGDNFENIVSSFVDGTYRIHDQCCK